MTQYTYFLRDYFENSGSHFFSKDHYYVLLDHCFRYGHFLSLVVRDSNVQFVKDLQKWETSVLPSSANQLENINNRKFYTIADDEIRQILLSDAVYLQLFSDCSQIEHTEDLAFLRKDGTVFFDSCFHEGEYTIYPHSNEDIGAVLRFGRWLPIDNNGVPNPPACEHQLIPFRRMEIEKDEFFILLQEIQDNPDKYLQSETIDELSRLINEYRPKSMCNFPRGLVNIVSFLPKWYRGFELFVLGKFGARTNSSILEVFSLCGYSGRLGFEKFYELLSFYISYVCPE